MTKYSTAVRHQFYASLDFLASSNPSTYQGLELAHRFFEQNAPFLRASEQFTHEKEKIPHCLSFVKSNLERDSLPVTLF